MCDCFHLAFPNWHGPATGAGRRLRGPEQETEDDSVCEEPETLEGERPRPQGSSPVEEFPTEKQAEEDSPHKSASNKKGRRLGFGSLFDKRSSAKMSETEDIQNGEAGVILKTVKETCAEGLVVTGGGKEGIFIKEVKPDSPASKHLTVKEGDQILSATVFFDNVSYEDALQILEHAQPYKMELCLRRKMESTTPEDDEIVHPEVITGNERGSPEMRSPRKKKQQDRISWPKFPSFGKGHRAQFKRSHSTSEAEEHKKLEMSPPTSDTESPLKSPLKSPDGKDKKKKQKIKLKMKMKSPRSKSVEESQRNEKELTSENLIVLEDEQVGDMLDEKLPEKPVTQLVEIAQDNKEAEYGDSSKIVNEVPSLSGMELQHKVHLISLSNTLKTTDISDVLAEASAGDMMISEEGKVQRSEIKFSIPQKDKSKIGVDSQSKTILEMSRTPDPSAHDTIMVSHGAISQAESETSQLVTDIKTEVISKDSSEKNLGSGDMKMSMPKLDVSLDLPDIGVLKQSPRSVSEKQWKEGTIFENEIYGIRTRGPLADIVTSKSHFTSPVNGLQFTPPDSSEMIRESNMPETITVISQPELNDLSAVSAIDAKDSHLEIKTSKLPTEANIDDILVGLDKRSESKFKVPKVDLTGCVIQEPTKMTHLPKREDIEIPGMEDKKSKPSLQTPEIKVPKIINITKEKEIKAQRTDEEFNVEDVKEAVSKFPALKLPEGDITGVLVQREITIMEMKADKTSTTPRGSPRKISGASDSSITITKSKIGEEKSTASHKDTVIKIPKVEPLYADEQTITMTKIDYSKPKGETQQTKTDKLLIRDDGQIGDVKFKLPKREDIEIPGMEAIEESTVQNIDMKVIKDQRHAPGLQGMSSSLLVEQPSVQIAVQSDIETSKMKKHGDKKGQEKKSKKPKVSMPSFGITKPDIRFPDVGIEIPKKDVPSKKDTGEIRETKLKADVPHSDIKLKDASLPEHTDLTLYRKETTSSMPDQKTTDDFKITVDKKTESINLTKFDDFTVKAPKAAVDISVVDVQDTKLTDIKCPEKDKEGDSVNVDIKAQDIKTEGQGRKFKLPKFEISFPEVKAPKISASKKEGDLSRADRKTEVPAMHGEMPYVQIEKEADKQELHSKGLEMKIQRPTFEFPKFGFSKSESKETEADMSVPTIDVSILDGSAAGANTGITATVCDAGQKDESKFGASTNIKLPSISVSKLGAKTPTDMSAMDIHVKEHEEELKLKAKLPSLDGDFKLPAKPLSELEKSVCDTQVKLSAEPQSADIKALEIHKEEETLSVDTKAQDIQIEGQSSKFKLPKFGIRLPEIKKTKIDLSGAKTELEVSLPERKAEVPPQDEVQDVKTSAKAHVPELDSKDSDVKAKQTSFSFPRFGYSKSEVKVSDTDVNLPDIDVSLPEGGAELERTNTNITVSIVDTGEKGETKSGYPAKFKIPSITLPTFGAKAPSEAKDISAVDAQAKGTEISLKETELKLSAEPLSTDKKVPDFELQEKSVAMKAQSIQNEGQGSKFKLPKFGINLPEVKGPKIGSIGLSAAKTETDISLPEVKMEVHPSDIEVQEGQIEVKAEAPEINSKGLEVKTKQSSFSFPKFGFSKSDTSEVIKVGGISTVDLQAKGSEISVPDAGLKLTAEPLSVDIKGPKIEKEVKSLSIDMKAQDIQIPSSAKTEMDTSLPEGKIEVHPPDAELPEGAFKVRADIPEIDSKGTDISLPEENVEVEGPHTDLTLSMGDTGQKDETKFDSSIKFRLPSITLPKFGTKASTGIVDIPAVDVQAKGPEISLPEAEFKFSAEPLIVDIKGPDVEKEETSLRVDMKGQDIQTEGQGIKIKLPKFGIGLPEVKGPKIDSRATKTEIDISLPKGKMEVHPPDVELLEGDIEVKAEIPEIDSESLEVKTKGSSFSFPKFGFSKSEVKAPKADASLPVVDVSLPEGNVELEGPKADITVSMGDTGQKDETKFGSPTKFKLPSITLPKFGAKTSKGAVEISAVDVQRKGYDINLPEAELKLSAEPLSVDIKGPDVELEKSLNVNMKTQDTEIEEQGSKFKLPKFGISLPEVTGPKVGSHAAKTDIDISLPEGKMEVYPPDAKLPEGAIDVKADIPEIDSKGLDVKTKRHSFSFPKFGFSKSEMKAPKADASLPVVDVSLPEGKVELEGPKADITVSMGDNEQKDETKFGSPTKFKLPSITLPKFGAKAPKENLDIPAVDVQAKGPEISLPEAELKLTAKPLSVDIKGPDVELEKSLNVDIKAQDNQTERQGIEFKLPKFGISLPEVKGPKIGASAAKTEIDISLPEGKMEVHPTDPKLPEGAIAVKADIPEIDSESLEVKTKGSSFSFPKFGFSKSEVKAPKADASLPVVDVSLPEGKVELEGPKADITVSMGDTGQKDETKFGSPTKFKLPSITLPKFGAKAPKGTVDIPAVDVQAKGPEISLPEAELKLTAEPISVDIKGPDVELEKSLNVDMKTQDIQTEGHGIKFKLPKFGISLPEVKGPKISSRAAKTEIDISLPEGKMEVHPPDAKLPEGAIEVKADIPEIDSESLEVKTKGSSFSFPKFGFSKSEMKAPKADAGLTVVDVSLPEGKVELEGPKADITVSMGDTGQKDETKFGSPTKFKLPSITLPKFGAKVPKGNVDIPAVDVQAKGPEISLPEAELKLTAKPISVDIKGPDVELEKSFNVDIKAQDNQSEGQGIEFKLPKFGISLPEVKGPKIGASAAKTEIDISLPEGKMEVHPPDAKLPEGAIEVKADIPEIDSESLEVKTKGSSFSFPKFGFSKSEMKAPKADASLPVVDVSLPEGKVELEGPNADITVSMGDTGQKDETKFGSPTKFKLPSITLPKFGAKAPKGTVEISAVDVQAKGPEISLPEAELKLTAKPISVDIKGPDVELEKSLSVDMKTQDIQTEGHGIKFKLPKFGISLPEVKGPKIGASAAKTEIDISLPEGKMEVHPPDAKLPEGAIEVKADIPEIDSESLEVKTKGSSFSFPKFGFSKSEMKAPKADASLPVVDVSLPEGKVELEGPNTDITVSMGDTGQKDETKFGSPTKFKLPSITLPKFGAKAPKGNVDIPAVDVQAKGPEISLPEAELKLTAEPISVDIKGPDVELEKSFNVDMKTQDIQIEGHGIKFKLPKFGISLPEVKGPKIGASAAKTEIDISLPEGKMEVHPPDAKLPEGAIEVKADIPEIDSESLEVKTKGSSFSFPKFGFSKSEMKAPKADASLPVVDVSLPEGKVELEGPKADITVSMGDTGQKDETKFGSPTKFKLPSITLPKFGAKVPKGNVNIPAVDVQAKGPEISLPEAELKLTAEPISVDIKGPDVELEKSLNVDMKGQDIQTEGQGIEFKLPKFGISLPEVKGPKIGSSAAKTEIDISLPEGKMEVHPPDAKLPEGAIEVKADIPEIDSESLEVKTKGSSFSIPKFGFSKSEMKAPKADASLPVVDISLPEGKVELEGPKADITVSMGDTGQKDETKFGSPTKFKLPSITLPKFGAKAPKGTVEISAVDVQGKGYDISLPEAELKLSAEPLSVDIKGPDIELKEKTLSVDVKAQDIQTEGEGIKFKLPKFGISLPEVTGPKVGSSAAKADIDISLPEGKMEVYPPDAKLPEGAIDVKADIPEIDSKGLDVKTKGPSFSFPKFGFSKSEMKAPKADASLPVVDVSLPEGNVELEGPKTDITVSTNDTEQKDKTKFGSPTKFKLPSITLPKFGAKAPKGNVDIPAVDVQAKGPEISLTEAELNLTAKPLSVDIKGPDVEKEGKSLTVDMKGQDIQTEGQEIKFKLPKFGIGLPEVKGPKISSSAAKTEIDISLPEGKMEVHPPDAKLPEGAIEVKADIPEIDSKGLHVKTNRSSFSIPKFGFSKSEMKAPKADASLPVVDISLPEGKVELEGPNTDITVSMGDTGQKDETKFGSPTKFKLPSITFPKFGAKVPKGNVDIPAVDVQAKGPEISLPEAELKLSAEPLSVDIKGPDIELEKSLDVDMKGQDTEIEEQGSKFKLPKFGISLPEVKGPKISSSAAKTEIDISLPEGKMEVHPPDAKLPEGAIEVKADKPEIDSKGLDVKTKRPSFSFPKFGFSKSEVKAPKADASLLVVDVSLPEGNVELEGPNTDITVSMGDTGQKDETKFGSPTKLNFPSITLPKFGAKAPKGTVDIPAVDVQAKGPEISLPDAELKFSAEPLSVDIKGPDVEKEGKSLRVDMKTQDIQIEEGGSKFKLPKFGIGLPEVKGPKISSSAAKTEIDISLPEGKMEVHPPDAKQPVGAIAVKADIPEIDSRGLEVKTKGPSFSFPKFGFSKSEIKDPKADASLPVVDVSLTEGKVELEGPNTDITVSMGDTGQKDERKFGSPTKFKLPSITLPKFGAKAPKGKVDMPAVDVQVKGHDISLPEAELELSAEPLPADVMVSDINKQDISLSVDMKAQNIHTEGQGSKFKLPKFGIGLPEVKGPKVGSREAKKELDITLPEGKMEVHPPDVEISAEISVPEKDIELNARDQHLKLHDSQAEVEIKDTIQKPPETAVKTEQEEKGSPSKFKLPTIKMSKISISKTKSQDGDNDTGMRVHVPEVILESKHKKETQGQEKSSRFTMPTLGDVLRGFDVEFNVPTLDETERAKTETAPAKLEFSLPSEEGDKIADSEANLENNEKKIMVQTDQKPEDEEKQTKPEKSSWFRFPKFSSPTKTAKVVEKESSQPPKETEESSVNDNKEKEPELSSARGTEEDSPTLSLRSSDAFADVSSAQTSEQVGLSLTSPTKVKVKYSESSATVEIGDLHGDVITSTARTELITMEPHQPEKVNIPCSSEMSSSSVDTMRQMSGEIHMIVSNIQNVPSTQRTTIITNVDTQDVQSLPLERVAMQSDSVLSVENTRVRKERHTVVERHIVKEMSGEEKVFVTRRTQVFEGDSVEPISDDTAFSIQKLRDTVHTEKMRFFESAESNEQNTMSNETSLKYIDSSTEENEGK
ncbi:neuroblast differentiation-associated protein AHNAK-like [Colossoma macropomum]|uniref:neuroblast differentiation-associated protein AHNAK-like n=1 Tax=Colossoma macropomum TaxID=42526 RepID=UPI0018651DF7|nr:neuroblast differentiation-associated protein AHNAK-like [Colossoma macropomum]